MAGNKSGAVQMTYQIAEDATGKDRAGAHGALIAAVGEGNLGLGADLLWGVNSIAHELGLTKRQTYHQLETGKLPAQKQAGKWVASRRGLRAHFAGIIAGEIA
jgi:hypothetical protein